MNYQKKNYSSAESIFEEFKGAEKLTISEADDAIGKAWDSMSPEERLKIFSAATREDSQKTWNNLENILAHGICEWTLIKVFGNRLPSIRSENYYFFDLLKDNPDW